MKKYIIEGWPEKDKVDTKVRMYHKIKHELSNENGVILKNERIFIPKSQRKEILDQLHIGHIGI